ncbi:MAG: heme exporter protein CcmD [Gammaproteobacteria bacterium]|jgi:heme exporter protein CcmD|nr:heme exporter protein CcmD [Gammaproteobacteria bacterium]NNL00251.1 heme exporter protein CcmD [Xanthomonadales bacterium]
MSHTPFILGSYLVGTVVLLWAALAPVINKRGLLRQLKARQARMEKTQ